MTKKKERKIAVSFPSAAVLGGLPPSETLKTPPKRPFRTFDGQEPDGDRNKKGIEGHNSPTMEATNIMTTVSDPSMFQKTHGHPHQEVPRPEGWTPPQQQGQAPQSNQTPQVVTLSKKASQRFQVVLSTNLDKHTKEELLRKIVEEDIGPGFWTEVGKTAVMGMVIGIIVVGTLYTLSMLMPAAPAAAGPAELPQPA